MRPLSFPVRAMIAAAVFAIQTRGDCPSAGIFDGVYPLLLSKQSGGVARLEWPSPGPAYDIVRGDLKALRTTNGDFALATERCSVNDTTAPGFDDAELPEAGEGFWYVMRWDQTEGFPEYGAQSYNEEAGRRAHQVADRDHGIGAATRGCACYYFCCYEHPGQCFFGPWP